MKLPIVFAGLLLLSTAGARATEAASPVGVWKTIDDETGQPHGLVELYQQGDELQGRILKGFPRPGEPEHTLCEKCTGEHKDKPLVGMVFLWGLKKDGDVWRDGEILDPDSGDIYSARLKLIDDGKKLEVRGFLGVSLFGRTQVWEKDQPASRTD